MFEIPNDLFVVYFNSFGEKIIPWVYTVHSFKLAEGRKN